MPDQIPVSLQMYTLRDDAARDFAGTIAQVAKIGYSGVEIAGYGNAKGANVVKQMLDDNGLTVTGAHVGLDALENDFGKAVEDVLTLGSEYVIVPYLAAERRATMDGYRQLAMILNEIGAKLRDSDLTLCYHNHDFEFQTFGGDVTGFDTLFGATDAEVVKVELDTFWVKKAGLDPVVVMHKYAGRVPLIHLKDMTPEGDFAEVGEGTMDFGAIFAAASVAGAEVYVVEQDQCKNHAPLESVRISFENLKRMGVVS